MAKKIKLILCSILIFNSACESGSSSSSSGLNGTASGPLPDNISVTGSLAIDTSEGISTSTDLVDKTVQLIADNGDIISESLSGADGSFALELKTTELGLARDTEDSNTLAQIARIRTIFMAEADSGDSAVGINKLVIISSGELQNIDGEFKLQTGVNKTKKVGAIFGKITLETGEDPTGTEVYIPGTTYIAKTDANGEFLLGFLPAGTYLLRADRNGYNSIEWSSIEVKRKNTTVLDTLKMQISTGPKIEKFELVGLSEASGEMTIAIKLSSATKYRISKLGDFSDTIYKPVDVSKDEFLVKMEMGAGQKTVTVHLEATDSEGLSQVSQLELDREAPLLGSIALSGSNSIVNSENVPLVLFVENGTKMRFSESVSTLSQATKVDYSTSHTYALANANEGSRRIYVEYLDDAGNSTGSAGEIYVDFVLDTTAVASSAIELLPPATPTGAFNTPLSWTSDSLEILTYYVEVYSNDSYTGSPIRTMTTTSTNINVSPPLDTPGTFYWRLRAADSAGNNSPWIESGSSKGFTIKVLAESYQSAREVEGGEDDGQLARDMISVGDLNGDGRAEIAYSITKSEVSAQCDDCGKVIIYDRENDAILANISDNLNHQEKFGHHLTVCDVNDDGKDELVVSAPSSYYERSTYTYRNRGAVFVYDLTNFSKIAKIQPALPNGNPTADPAPGYGNCYNEYSGADATTFKTFCGDQYYSFDPIDVIQIAAAGNSGPRFGSAVACKREAGADSLFISEPGYYDEGQAKTVANIYEYKLTGNTFQKQETISDPEINNWDSQFGFSLAFFQNFKFSDSGTCSTGATLAASNPKFASASANVQGKVYLFQFDGTDWNECGAIEPGISEIRGTTDYFGFKIFNLGDIDEDGSVEELAVSSFGGDTATFDTGGHVRIFGGSAGTQLKSLRIQGPEYVGLGYVVAPAGDFNNDGHIELAITAPRARVNGQFRAGRVFIYEWSAINANDTGSDGAPTLVLDGRANRESYLGASFVPNLEDEDLLNKPDSMLIASPGFDDKVSCDPAFPASCNNNTAPAGEIQYKRGAFQEFEFLKLAPSLPSRIVGSGSNSQFGSTLLGVPDLDDDGADDFVIGQAGARCDGKPYGSVSFYSVVDKVIAKNICGYTNGDKIGTVLRYLPKSNGIVFSNQRKFGMNPYGGAFYGVTTEKFLQISHVNELHMNGMPEDISPNKGDKFVIDEDEPAFSKALTANIAAMQKDVFATGIASKNSDQGSVFIHEIQNGAMNDLMMNKTEFMGSNPGVEFGFAVDIIKDIDPGAVDDQIGIVASAPGYTKNTADGAVFIFTTGGAGNIDEFSPAVIASLFADDAKPDSEDAEPGFGSNVLALPDLGNYDPDGENLDAIMYVAISNTNMIYEESDSVTPELFVYAIVLEPAVPGPGFNVSVRRVLYDTGDAGTMFGGYMKQLPDINGDGAADFVVSIPGGQGQLGNTGQVRIYSGAGMTTLDTSDDILQVLYNPDSKANHFGVAVEYADITGDGLADFVVGASRYDTSYFVDAGAVYIFPMAPVK